MGSHSASSPTALVVDDEPAIGKVLKTLLAQDGIAATCVTSAAAALEHLRAHPVDVVLSDLRMPAMDGLELLARVKDQWPGLPVVLLTSYGTVSLAVEAMKRGASDFMLKPFDRQEIVYTVRKALAAAANTPDSEELPTVKLGEGFVGDSAPMREAYEMLSRAASTSATVLLRGESGTGKELAAKAIHQGSPRRDGPFVKLHCAALPDALLESELFGYERGAFSGAAQRKPGRVELAHGGTLFLDEIGDVPLAMQVKLLRVLQEREFERLGGTQTLKADVRFVAATHRDLEAMVRRGEFREDLFYRLNVVPVWLPPLRQRPGDLVALARHFCAVLSATHGRPGVTLDPSALDLLRAQPWPGNVRQLQNFIERLVVLSPNTTLTAVDVRREFDRQQVFAPTPPAAPIVSGGVPSDATPAMGTMVVRLDDRRRETEREALLAALSQAGDNRSLAARILGVSRRTLYNKLEEHGLR